MPVVVFSQEEAIFSFKEKKISEVLFSLEQVYDVRFSYSSIIVKKKNVTLSKKSRTLTETLDEIEFQTNLVFTQINERYYSLRKKETTLNDLQQLDEVIIHHYLTKGISKSKKGYFCIKPLELEILPGLIETDVLESIQQLPGVVSPNETATGLIVRGGTADQNRIMWDGINIYHNGHLFGMVSAFNPNVSQKISFYNKGTNPRFGERISSVIDIRTNDKISKQTKGSFSLNGLNADVVLETPLLKDKLSIQVSARRSYVDLYKTPTYNIIAKKVFQNTKISDSNNTMDDFFFVDYNTKINYKINRQNRLSFSGIYITNGLNHLAQDDNTEYSSNDILKIKNEGYALDWQTKWDKNTTQRTSFSFSKYYFKYNLIARDALGKTNSDFEKRNAIYDTNIVTEFNINTNKQDKLSFGYQYSLNDVGYAFLYTKELEYLLDYEKSRVNTHSFFSNYSYKNNRLFDIEAGFRLNYYNELDKLKFEPRIILNKSICNHLTLQLTGEIKNQIISQIDETVMSDLSLENKLWHLADDKTFPITQGNQVSAGLLYKNKGWSFDVDHYNKNINGITALSLGFLNPDGQSFRIGKKRVKGIDFYAKKSLKHFNIWISYAFTDVRSKFHNLNNDDYFASNTNITHAFSSSIAYKIKELQLTLGWKWRTGKPYTKANLVDNEIQFIGINSERLPNYHRLDFSSTYKFDFLKDSKLKGELGVSIRNIYNQRNHLSREYSGYNTLNDPIRVRDQYSLGFTPNFLFKLWW